MDDSLRFFWFGYSIFTAEQLLFNIRVRNSKLCEDICKLEDRLNWLSNRVKSKKNLDYGRAYSLFFAIHKEILNLEKKLMV